MRVLTLFLYLNPLVWGQHEDINLGDEILSILDLENAPRRVPRQVKALLSKETKPHILELSVKTTIISRYAFTAISCTMFNRHSAAKQGVFNIQVPAAAFISNFTMIIAGRVFPSQVRPREKKVKQVKEDDPKTQNKETGQQSYGKVETFSAVANVPGRNRVVFLLAYEELLQRRLGSYQLVTSLRPRQLVSRLSVDVTILEHSEITHLEVLPLRSGRRPTNGSQGLPSGTTSPPVSTVIRQNKTYCKISFSPNIIQQAKIATNGILGDFIVQYDVARELGIGDVQVQNGHFVHYFAPKDLPAVPKNVIFVIDTSASMVGTKIRQTKEALFTILKDLRPRDRFNFVSFSNRIKVWQPGRLVQVTPNNIRDAKKFIYMISPTGGTDINAALQTGSSLLGDYLSSPGAHNDSVSLLIFLTDGRPTVGEVRSPSILHNAKSAVGERFCIFTIGMGEDVDYRLLQRLSLDNCGTTRRIREEADASSTLKGFYDEIGTPLLSDIRVEYTEDSVEYVTQHSFTNYFNGSEIVIAGKLTNQSAETLHVQVRASSSDRSIVLATDVALREREQELARRTKEADLGPAGEGFVERLWGFLSIKDELRSRLRSQGSREREEITQQALNRSLAYNFLTPLTSVVVEAPDVQVDGAAADNAAEQSATGVNEKLPSPPGKAEQLGKPMKKPKTLMSVSKTSADGDPHFVVDFPLSKLTACFNINGEPGHVLRLVSDRTRSGVTVNGKLIGAPAPVGRHKRQRTYFSTIAVVLERPRRAYLEITPRKVILDGQDRLVLSCDTTVAVESDGLSVAIAGRSNITITIHGTIVFLVLVHQYKNPAPYQRDHLGFYIANSKGLSTDSHGLLGQFLYQEVGLIHLPRNTTELPNTNHEPGNTTQLPTNTNHEPGNTTQLPANTNHEPGNTTQLPANTNHEPGNTTQLPANTNHEPGNTTQLPANTNHEPGNTTQLPANTNHEPWNTTQLPANTNHEPGNTTQLPANTNHEPWNTTQLPANTNHEPWNTTQLPANTNHEPWNTTQLPANTNHEPGNTTQLPANTNHEPGNTTQLPTNTKHLPGNATNQPANITHLPPISTRLSTNTSKLHTNIAKLPKNTKHLPTNTTQLPTNATRLSTNTAKFPKNTKHLPTNTLQLPINTTHLQINNTKLHTSPKTLATNTKKQTNKKLPTNTTKLPTDTTKLPTDTKHFPTNTTELPTNTTELPTNTTKLPTDTKHFPTNTTKLPTDTTKLPTDTKHFPTNTTKLPTNTTKLPTDTKHFPTNTTELPISVKLSTKAKQPENTSNGGPPPIQSHVSLSGTSPALKIKGRTVAVSKKTRKIYSGTEKVDCWFVRNNAAKLIDGQYLDYVVLQLFDTGNGTLGMN